MGCGRALLCFVFPPAAVADRGCGSFLVVLVLTFAGWIPGIIGALVICNGARPEAPPRPVPREAVSAGFLALALGAGAAFYFLYYKPRIADLESGDPRRVHRR